MNRVALVLALLALCAAAASLWMFRGARSSMNQMEQKVEAAVQGQESDLEKWASRLRQGRGIPIPVKTPRNLSGVHRLEWTDRSLDFWGWDEKRCRDEGGEGQRGACRFAVSNLAVSSASSPGRRFGGPRDAEIPQPFHSRRNDRTAVPLAVPEAERRGSSPERSEGGSVVAAPGSDAEGAGSDATERVPPRIRFEEEFRRIQAEVSSSPCREEGALSACEIGVELDLPTLQGVGELVGRLAKWPFVLSGLRWEDGKLSLQGYLVLR